MTFKEAVVMLEYIVEAESVDMANRTYLAGGDGSVYLKDLASSDEVSEESFPDASEEQLMQISTKLRRPHG